MFLVLPEIVNFNKKKLKDKEPIRWRFALNAHQAGELFVNLPGVGRRRLVLHRFRYRSYHRIVLPAAAVHA